MQMDNAKQGSGLKLIKTIGKWALVPGLGVPATKWVESHYNVSFFSPAISGLWDWITSVGRWLGRDVTLPFWLATLVVLITLALFSILVVVYRRSAESEDDHSTMQFTDKQILVLAAVGDAMERGAPVGFDELVSATGLSRITNHNALDVLLHNRMITTQRSLYGQDYIALTYAGREFYLELLER